MKRISTLATLALLLAGCATTSPPVFPPETQHVDIPPLNTITAAEIGETLVAKGKLYVYDGLELQERISDNGVLMEYFVEPGPMRLERIDQDGSQYFVPGNDAYFANDKISERRIRPRNAYLVRKGDGSLELTGQVGLSSAGKITPVKPQHKIGKIIDRKQPNFRQELLYGGRIGNQIRLTYREFSDDFVRPGFAQEAQYDLGADETIGFKGVRIQVIEATNTTLKYKVLKSFPNLP